MIGGAGNLGAQIVLVLLERNYANVATFDLVPYRGPRANEVVSFVGDITDLAALQRAMRKACSATSATTVFHTASIIDIRPVPSPRMTDVNVGGTECVLAAAQTSKNVRAVIYTSSLEVVSGRDGKGKFQQLQGCDEAMAYPAVHHLPYAATKARAEKLVLAADCSARASGEPPVLSVELDDAIQDHLKQDDSGAGLEHQHDPISLVAYDTHGEVDDKGRGPEPENNSSSGSTTIESTHGEDEDSATPAKDHNLTGGSTGSPITEQVKDPRGLLTCVIRPGFILGPGCLAQTIAMRYARKRFNYYLAAKIPATISTVGTKNCAYCHVLAAEQIDSPEVHGHCFFNRDFEDNIIGINEYCFRNTGITVVLLPLWLAYMLAWLMDRLERLLIRVSSWGLCGGRRRETSPEVIDVRAARLAYVDMVVSDERARRVLGYEPLMTREESLEGAAAYCRAFYKDLMQSDGSVVLIDGSPSPSVRL